MQLDEALERPFDPDEAREYDRERFGMTPEQLLAQQQTEALMAESTYE